MQNPDPRVFTSQASASLAVLDALNAVFKPHPGQVLVLNALFVELMQIVFIDCGRKWGKTEVILYILYRWALFTPNGQFYYIAPYAKQAREIIWASRRLQNFLPEEMRKIYIEKVKDDEMRIIFRNGAFIKLDGADNFEAYRGVNPHGAVYEEFKDHRPEFHRAFGPNLATHSAPLVIIGTPEIGDDTPYNRMADECKSRPDAAYFNMPTWINPFISKVWLKSEYDSLQRRGEPEVWELEYACNRIKTSRLHVFGMLSEKHVVGFNTLMGVVGKRHKSTRWVCVADPASASCFAVLFIAWDKFTKKIMVMDELYITDMREMSVKKMWAKIAAKIMGMEPDMEKWTFLYDEAEAWWANEMLEEYGVAWMPTHKHLNDKEWGLSLIKDQLNADLLNMSEKCVKLYWEMQNYIKDEKGRIPKKNDHAIDCLRYFNGLEIMSTVDIPEPPTPIEEERKADRRGISLEKDLEEMQNKQHWENDLVGDL